MTAQDLKNSILQLAVQGELVAQNPADEPASELLKRIQAEKVTALHAGIIKKDKKLPEIEEAELPYDTPDTWEWLRLGQLCQLLDGEKMSGVKYPYLEAKYLRGKIEGTILESGKFVRKGTRLILVDGENSGEVFFATEDGYMGSTFKVLYIPDAIYAPYVLYFLLLKKQLFRNRKTGAAIPHLNKELFFNLLIPVPPFAEQERIVAKLEELLPFVSEYDKTEKRLSALNDEFPDKLRKSILQQAVQGKLTERDPSDEPASELLKRIQTEKAKLITEGKIKKEKALLPIAEDDCPFEIPGTWKWVKFGEIADLCLGKMLDKAKNQGNLHPYLRNVNVRWGFFDFEDILKMRFKDDEEERYSVKYGDLVVCEGGEPGRCAVWTDVSQTFRIQKALHRVRFIGDVDSFYAYRVFEYYASNGYFAKRFTGETIKHLPGEVLKNIAFPLPPIAEQKRIVVRINELLEICDGLKHVR